MVFSSISFIFVFLPILLAVYYLTPAKFRKYVLLPASLLFYFIGEPRNVIFLIISCVVNYYFSTAIARAKRKQRRKRLLAIAILYNVIQLAFFKYTNFFLANFIALTGAEITLLNIALPIGISFYTFQAISYVVDVYWQKHKPAKSVFDFATYLCLFPQLIAGPIVRYVDVRKDLRKCQSTTADFALGVRRFIFGLSKKVLVANVLGEFIKVLTVNTVASAWLRPLAFTLQIYFDFSGYSDMAIGLGLMLGFHFKENFDYPLIAATVTDFWRRWHISLGSWFRDYIYIPLGGNRVVTWKWLRNILVVWALTGFWHGASWNFVLWGLFFGVLLLIEKLFLLKVFEKLPWLGRIFTIVAVIISFMIFSVEGLPEIGTQLSAMFGNAALTAPEVTYYLRDYAGVFIVAIIAATPLAKLVTAKLQKTKYTKALDVLEPVVLLGLFVLCIAFVVDESYSPFLYFRF